ncbi:MAG: arginine repressor [Desemzia incerta]|uniref:Arginine repressor n=1 Tax=Desemzia incerta TaxID=82801 RepID=A0A1I5YHE8_9LACT|nr:MULTISPECIES: arginine repressor [Desemzia]MCI3029954.1 arginine repressor [Desemzia sp. C1]WHZ31855.1 arginine repressor [Desemzia incerta]SFQ43609.1 transcriptional regulator, ArgR family [Desemzia incerta]
MKKTNRQLAIKQIITNRDISTQDELLHYLKEEGVDATQATISRDIKEMNLIKTSTPQGGMKYTLYQTNNLSVEERLQSTLGDVVVKLERVQFMTILVTIPGNAHVAAALIDTIEFPEVVASVGGNDTCLLISKDEENAQKMYDYLKQFVNIH